MMVLLPTLSFPDFLKAVLEGNKQSQAKESYKQQPTRVLSLVVLDFLITFSFPCLTAIKPIHWERLDVLILQMW